MAKRVASHGSDRAGRLVLGLRAGLAALLMVALAGCATQVRHHGYAPDDRALAEVDVGRHSRDDVADLVGRPGSTGLMRDSGWYYVASKREHFAYRAPVETDREVVAISFDQGGRVSNIERFGLENGEVVALSRRVTDSQITGTTLIAQIFRNIGNFTAGQFF
ncbi:outer membrane protein assembly factor BamE [Alkalilacustris brevis]|uniref:outer membrane protein assembly factor BamE n=1 Tax=Alkalilacustris brevis TaxID=2026338 RepID=UPI000E0DBEB8|nr:outer membrane protein assembly factor BamE [Alkalilacustris brevis]